MARQRSGSSSARNPRGPRGARPASNRPKAAPAAPAAKPPVDAEPPPTAAPALSKAPTDAPATEVVVEEPDDLAEDLAEDEAEYEDEAQADDESDEAEEAEAEAVERSTETAAMWADVRIAPVEVSLPRFTGYTLRAYRMSNELAAVEVDDREDEFAGYLDEEDEDEPIAVDDDELAELLGRDVRKGGRDDDEDDDLDALDDDDPAADASDASDDDDEDEEEEEDDEPAADASDEDEEDEEDEDEEDDEPAAEEVPVFLGRRGKLYLFGTAEALVEFVQTNDDHDLAQLDTWDELRERLAVDDVVPEDEDRYEFDLVVDNLRGGADALDFGLLIRAGEAARDIAYATRLEPVITALAPGSRLDDLDEAVRTADSGGLRAFLARRKLRRIVTHQTALGWRTIIGKISDVVDWRN